MPRRRLLTRLVTIFPKVWPTEAPAAYAFVVDADDTARQAELIFQEISEAVDLETEAGVTFIETRIVTYGPA